MDEYARSRWATGVGKAAHERRTLVAAHPSHHAVVKLQFKPSRGGGTRTASATWSAAFITLAEGIRRRRCSNVEVKYGDTDRYLLSQRNR
jgi:hypothetical protein